MKHILYYDRKWLDWSIRIIAAYDLIMAGLNNPSTVYPLYVLILVLIGFWFYTFKLKSLCLAMLLLAAFGTYFHYNDPHMN